MTALVTGLQRSQFAISTPVFFLIMNDAITVPGTVRGTKTNDVGFVIGSVPREPICNPPPSLWFDLLRETDHDETSTTPNRKGTTGSQPLNQRRHFAQSTLSSPSVHLPRSQYALRRKASKPASTMSSDDLEGDDIWGDDAGGGGGGNQQQQEASSSSAQQEAKDGDEAPVPPQQPSQPPQPMEAEEPLEDDETRHMTVSELRQRIHLLNNDIRIMKSDVQRITHESRVQRERIKENQEKVKVNKQLPFLVANVVEILEPDAEDGT